MMFWSVIICVAVAPGPVGQSASQREEAAELAAYHARARAAVDEVLALREFSDLRASETWWVSLISWLERAARSVGRVFEEIPSRLFWLIVVWLVLTLLAILGHFAYVLLGMIRAAAVRRGTDVDQTTGRGELLGIRDLDFDAVYRRAREFLAAGNWCDATKYLYVAAILWLDRQGWLTFRASKTNNDYLSELAGRARYRTEFGQLTNRFESTVYGGEAHTATNCQEMAALVERLVREATPVVAL